MMILREFKVDSVSIMTIKKSEEDWNGSIPAEGSYSLDYLIGGEDYLGCGNGPKIVKLLTEEIYSKTDAKRIIVQPEPGNAKSRNTLLSAGYRYDESNDLFYLSVENRPRMR